MHVVAEARGGGVFGMGDRRAGPVDRGADIGFGESQHPDWVEAGGVEALGADAFAERCVEAPPGLKPPREWHSSRQLEDNEPIRAGGFDPPRYVGARERLARQVLEDEVGDDEVEGADGRVLGVGEGDVRDVGVEPPGVLEHTFGEIDADGLVEPAREGAGEAADAAAEVEYPFTA